MLRIIKDKFSNIEIPEKVQECVWDEWQLGDCSKSCGGGMRIDTRKLKSKAVNGGYCNMNGDRRMVKCSTHSCPGIQ